MSRTPLIRDPRVVPVVAHDGHLPAVAPDRLTPDALRQRFAAPPPWTPELPGDGGRFADREPRPASVLVPLVNRPDGLTVLLTRRTDHLHDHAGQISFPGGRAEPEEADDPVATALREAEEEVGLARRHIEVVGRLPTYLTITAYVVTPVVALVEPGFELALDAFEVAEAFEVPLAFLMTPAHHQRHAYDAPGGVRRHFLSMPWTTGAGAVDAAQAGDTTDPVAREYFIWGATAAMLRNFYRFLAA
ncbi:MAG TPA: CoA pyrophosphatase [Burkholderiaceae bacterium]|nr:CoA pyrophosphatase [Burkholderiaceae bacterium]HMX09945.1 CoA pyrophosphatase [Burkholderiaceae bacterium]HMY99046.1 CoA pyrophosphatase [Burkholderiaceae bacterium]HNB43241.1 CoA pyrophosphatase [Burkholderiaceae bacterium]HNG78754.1 CoA pyrophosphatase [Burkholderiaceae bacterium]